MTDSGAPNVRPISMPGNSRREQAPEVRQAAIAFREILRALAPDPSRNPHEDAVRFTEATEALMRRVLERYGFERLPADFAELFGLFEYCDNLDAASGVGMRPPEQWAEWQAASFEVWRRKQPELMPAIELFCAGDIERLRALHRDEDTLARLGRTYLQPAD
jgi:hypothetical protein